jgi:tight adherence protein C
VIADEFDLIAAELRAGKARADVLRDFARRVGLDDISAFVTVLIHSEQFGTSLAEALRVYASEMRTKRLLRAEEKANQLPVKLSMIVVFCTIPSVLLLLAGPAVVNIAKAFSQMGRIH